MSGRLKDAVAAPAPAVVDRHTRINRLTHWINLLCVAVLLMSGLPIFNAHPALYWGQVGADADLPNRYPEFSSALRRITAITLLHRNQANRYR